MPCHGPGSDLFTRSEMKRRVKKKTRNAERKRLEKQARTLFPWLHMHYEEWIPLSKTDAGDGSQTARLCGLIRAIGEEQLFAFLAKHAVEYQAARMLFGWWEAHKIVDEADAQENKSRQPKLTRITKTYR